MKELDQPNITWDGQDHYIRAISDGDRYKNQKTPSPMVGKKGRRNNWETSILL